MSVTVRQELTLPQEKMQINSVKSFLKQDLVIIVLCLLQKLICITDSLTQTVCTHTVETLVLIPMQLLFVSHIFLTITLCKLWLKHSFSIRI